MIRSKRAAWLLTLGALAIALQLAGTRPSFSVRINPHPSRYAQAGVPTGKASPTSTTATMPRSPTSTTTRTKSSTTDVGGPLAPVPQAATNRSAGRVLSERHQVFYRRSRDKRYGQTKAGA